MSNKRRIRHVVAPRLADAGQDLDIQFFECNPTQRGYTRLATPDELKATDMPPGTKVYVHLIGTSHRARAFIPPTSTRSN